MAQLSLYELLSAEQTGDVSVNTVDMMLKISYQVEDIVIDNELPVDFFAGFQRFSHFRHQNQRYHRLAQVARRVYVFGEADITPPTIPGVQFIPLAPGDPLIREWFLVVNTPSFFTALLTQEMPGADPIRGDRRFRGLWTYDEQVISNAYLLLSQLLRLPYRPVTQRDYRTQNQYLVRMSNKLVQYSEAATLDLAQSENTVTMLAQVAQEVGGSGTLDAILPTVAVALQQALLSQTIRIYLQESDGTGLRLAASAGGNGPVPPTLHGDGGIIGEAVAAGRPVVIPDTLEAGEYDPLDPTVLSLAAVPLQAGAQTLGALVIGRAMVNGFDDLSLRLLTAVAAQVSLAVERAAQMGERERLERLLQIVLATSTDGVITTDAGGAILALNSVAAERLGLAQGSALPRHLRALGNADLSALLDDAAARQGDSFREIHLPDGESLAAGASLVSDAQNRPMGWVIVLHAAGVVPTETVSVVFDPTLAGGAGVGTGTGLLVDRDLDNRLRQISGLTALLPTRIPLDEDQTRLVGQIIKLTRETARLVNNLVYLHELESGTTMLREPLDLGPLLGDLVERYQPAAIRRGVSLKLHTQLLPPMPGYAPAIGRALQNLLENAIKYTPSGGTIMVGVDEQENQAEITVSDTGIGLWPRDLGLVFNRFYRVINPQNQETPSAGLGLAVVKAVAEAHGGRAWATSTLGQGSVFGLTLPLFEG